MSAKSIIDGIIRTEGGYVNHPNDKGGPTNYGITQATLERWRGQSVSADDVRTMPRDEAMRIYEAMYVDPFRFAEADGPVFEHMIDMGVNHGITGAMKILQRSLKVSADGVFGPKSLAAYASADKSDIGIRLISERAMKFARIVKANPSQAVFIEGWMARCMSFLTGDHA